VVEQIGVEVRVKGERLSGLAVDILLKVGLVEIGLLECMGCLAAACLRGSVQSGSQVM
jgi:hypothetical protein